MLEESVHELIEKMEKMERSMHVRTMLPPILRYSNFAVQKNSHLN